jgi:hypothetical protein
MIIRTIFIRNKDRLSSGLMIIVTSEYERLCQNSMVLSKVQASFREMKILNFNLRVRQSASYPTSSNRAVLSQAPAVLLCPSNFHWIRKMWIYKWFPEKEKGGARGLAK